MSLNNKLFLVKSYMTSFSKIVKKCVVLLNLNICFSILKVFSKSSGDIKNSLILSIFDKLEEILFSLSPIFDKLDEILFSLSPIFDKLDEILFSLSPIFDNPSNLLSYSLSFKKC